MRAKLRNDLPLDVREWGYYHNGSVPSMRVGDEAIIQDEITCDLHRVVLLRGKGRRKYLVDVKQLRRLIKQDGDRKIAALYDK